MPAFPLLWPIIALVALIFVVWTTMVVQRAKHRSAHPPSSDDFASRQSSLEYYRPVERPAANFINLFEMPVLFFVLAILLVVTELANDVQVLLAWLYVAARAVHSWFHIAGRVKQRFLSYVVSVAILLAMWIGFTVDAVVSARAYNSVMTELEAKHPLD